MLDMPPEWLVKWLSVTHYIRRVFSDMPLAFLVM
jgi:hypothetical protein